MGGPRASGKTGRSGHETPRSEGPLSMGWGEGIAGTALVRWGRHPSCSRWAPPPGLWETEHEEFCRMNLDLAQHLAQGCGLTDLCIRPTSGTQVRELAAGPGRHPSLSAAATGSSGRGSGGRGLRQGSTAARWQKPPRRDTHAREPQHLGVGFQT